MSLQIGEILKDRYRIIQLLASGGMGIIYRARDESLGVEVALKETLPGGISTSRMQKIAAILADLHHPNLPRVTDTFQVSGGNQILVMDFVPGEDLKTRIDQSGPLSVNKAIEIVVAVGSALHYLHSCNPPIIHQDVKPGNIKITPDGHVMLVDFDLITVLLENQTRPSPEAQGLTPGFAAPEQYNNMADARSDQYGLASTLYFIMTGTHLPDALTRASGEKQLSRQSIPSKRLPMDIGTCLEKALSINPGDRYLDVQAFVDALTSIQSVKPSSTSISIRSLRNTDELRNKLFVPFLIGMVGIGILVVGTFFFIRGSSSEGEIALQEQQPKETVQAQSTDLPIVGSSGSPTDQKKPLKTMEILVPTNPEPKIAAPTPLGGGSGEYAFVSEKTGIPQIYLGSTDNTDTKQLTDIQDGACQPDWAPDGKRLVFTSPCLPKQQVLGKPEPYAGSGLFIMTLDEGNIAPLHSLPGGDFDPAWSPNGAIIAFTSIRNKFPQIFLFDISSETTTQITQITSNNRQPSWSPDGSTLAYCTNRTGSSQVWLMNKDGENAREFSVLANGAAFSPDWSPDGKEIIYSQTNSFRLVSQKLSDSGASESILNPRLSLAANPDYSPDGNWILIDSNIEGSLRIYRISQSGTGLEPISPAGEKAYQPEWKPIR